MKIIDVHTHTFPDKVALNCVPQMAETAGIKEAIDGRSCSLLDSMDCAGIDCSWLQPVATNPVQVDKINLHTEKLRSERLIPFGAVHPDYEDLPGLIRDLSKRGFPGVKIHPEYQKINPNDKRWFPLYETLIEEKMIALFHAGRDIGIPTLNSTPCDFVELHDRFPEMITILAHMGGFDQWKEVAEYIAGRDLYLDTSYSLGHFPDEDFIALVKQHGVQRILFGTDSPWADQKTDMDYLQSLSFSEDELKDILGGNAERLMIEHSDSTQ